MGPLGPLGGDIEPDDPWSKPSPLATPKEASSDSSAAMSGSSHHSAAHDSSEAEDGDETFVYKSETFVYADAAAQGTQASNEATEVHDEPHIDVAGLKLDNNASQQQLNGSESSQQASTSSATNSQQALASTSTASQSSASASIDYAHLQRLCISGSLEELQNFFSEVVKTSQITAFALANEPNPASGLVPIHYAAKEGRTEILKWLIENVGAIVDVEDREGETALHKAAMAGKMSSLTYLLIAGADANAGDSDGWTPLHNACSRGYLDIVKFLVETAGACLTMQGGRGKWTPLMNAASNGHLPIVRYLISKHNVNPLQRNSAGETAYDVAAASFEIYICEVLERYENARYGIASSSTMPYNPLRLHTTVPAIIHQNERLDTRISTLAIHGGKPRWSGTSAGQPNKADRRAPATMPAGPLSTSRMRDVPMRREDVELPVRADPDKLRLPKGGERRARARDQQRAQARSVSSNPAVARLSSTPGAGDDLGSTPTPASVFENRRSSRAAQRQPSSLPAGPTASSSPSTASFGTFLDEQPSHFWLCEWQIDRSHPQVDPEDGWQYAPSFDTPEGKWTAQMPPRLLQILDGRGWSGSFARALTAGAIDDSEASTDWVRRRRWIRVMRRRLDIDFGDDLEAAEQVGGTRQRSEHASVIEAAQRAAQQDLEALSSDADYLKRAQVLASGAQIQSGPDDAAIRGRMARLQMAIRELRSGAFTDDIDVDRQSRAEELLKEYTIQVGQLRQALSDGGNDEDEDDPSGEDDDDEDEFIYPNSFKDTQSVITRINAPGVLDADPSATTSTSPAGPSRASPSPSSIPANGSGAYVATSPSVVSTAAHQQRSHDLAQARGQFRVPTNDAPSFGWHQSRPPALQQTSLVPVWEHDDVTSTCRSCSKKFTFFTRKHHCRRCGKIFCADCSSYRAHLRAGEVVLEPGLMSETLLRETTSGVPFRICQGCHVELQLPESLRRPRSIFDLAGDGPQRRTLTHDDDDEDDHSSSASITSRASELQECPVCSTPLSQFGPQELQEDHLRICLESNGGGGVASLSQSNRYLVYRLPFESPILGRECIVCLEELDGGQLVARLPCLCFFHRDCIDSWLKRGRSCPTHAR